MQENRAHPQAETTVRTYVISEINAIHISEVEVAKEENIVDLFNAGRLLDRA